MANIEALNIQVDVSQATASLAKLDQQIDALKERQRELAATTAQDADEQKKLDEEYNAVTQSIKVLSQEKNALNREIQHTIKEAKAEEGSIASLRDHVANLYKEYVNMSAAQRDSAEGQAFARNLAAQQEELKKLEAAVGDYRRNVGNYANSMVEAFDSISPKLGGMLSEFQKGFGALGPMLKTIQDGIAAFKDKINDVSTAMKGATGVTGKLRAGFTALSTHPVIAILAVIVGLFMALKSRISESEENTNKLSAIMVKFKPILDAITNALDVLIGLFLDWVDLVTSAYTKIAELVAMFTDYVGITDNATESVKAYNEQVAAYVQLEKDHQALEKAKRENMVEEAKMRSEIARAMEEQKDLETNKQWTKSLEKITEARQKELKVYQQKKAIAQENLRILEEEAKQASNDAEANEKLAAAKAAVYKADEEYYLKEREYITKEKKLKDKQLADEKERREKEKKALAEREKAEKEHAEAILKTREKLSKATIALMEDGAKKEILRLRVEYNNKILENNKLIEEYYKKGWKKESEMLVQYNKLLTAQMAKEIAKTRFETEKQINSQIKDFNKLYNDFLTAYYDEGTSKWLQGMRLNIAAQGKQLNEQMTQQFYDLTKTISQNIRGGELYEQTLLHAWYGVDDVNELNPNLAKMFEKQKDIIGMALQLSLRELGGYRNDADKALASLNEKPFLEQFVEDHIMGGNGDAENQLLARFAGMIDQTSASMKKLNQLVVDYWQVVKASKEMRKFFRDEFEKRQNGILDQKMFDKEYDELIKSNQTYVENLRRSLEMRGEYYQRIREEQRAEDLRIQREQNEKDLQMLESQLDDLLEKGYVSEVEALRDAMRRGADDTEIQSLLDKFPTVNGLSNKEKFEEDVQTILLNINRLEQAQREYDEQMANRQQFLDTNREIDNEQLKYDQLLCMQDEYLNQEHENDKEFAKRKMELEYQVFEQKKRLLTAKANLTRAELSDTSRLLNSMSDMVAAFDAESKESVILQKSLGLATVLINEGIAISEAVKKNAEGSISPIQFALQMAAETATIAASIAAAAKSINSVKYSKGGLIDGKGSGTSDSNTVRVSRGEAIINAASVREFGPLLSQINGANGGRSIVTNQQAAGVDSSNFMASQMALALRAMPAPVVSVREIERTQNRVNVIESRARY